MTNPTDQQPALGPGSYRPGQSPPTTEYVGTDLTSAIQRFLAEGYALTAMGEEWAQMRKFGTTGCGTYLLLGDLAWFLHRSQESQTVYLHADAEGHVWAQRGRIR